MDLSATLEGELASLICDPERTLEETGNLLQNVREARLRAHPEGNELQAAFQDSLKLKNKLDVWESQVDIFPSLPHLAGILNCEYQIYKINEAIPLRHNPFLSHWVETIQRLDKKLGESSTEPNEGRSKDDRLTSHHIHSSRAKLVKAILMFRNLRVISRRSPKEILQLVSEESYTADFDLQPYVTILEDEGIYDKTPTPELEVTPKQSPTALSNKPNTKEALLTELEVSPDTAISAITHMPLDIPSLEIITSLLEKHVFEDLRIEPLPVLRDYLQHSLRLIEKMGLPAPNIPPDGPSSADGGGRTDSFNEQDSDEALSHDREAQVRAVKLILLFIRNLVVHKKLLPPQEIYYEINEICVRYIWLKEVREFRAFIEQGADARELAGAW
ncbi:uncharacterized protein BDZ99DRAFT_2661 [Mytilinidion resinicola]|uniref:Uncharacterized protein n=1 Tax=Mytilinidion resinicola TaxID=574789 RepID=A0A6A6Z6V1_9PEZI|nr:uncharacterized protein BDZ99DRAFT_2661 [Mytilinidion resinicola]KAF2816832.1 hypothetical protein BDZ99DRAFT_2661 [Mytilinidion resinicola]